MANKIILTADRAVFTDYHGADFFGFGLCLPYSNTSSVTSDILFLMPFFRLNSISSTITSRGNDLKCHIVGLQKWHLLGHPRVI